MQDFRVSESQNMGVIEKLFVAITKHLDDYSALYKFLVWPLLTGISIYLFVAFLLYSFNALSQIPLNVESIEVELTTQKNAL